MLHRKDSEEHLALRQRSKKKKKIQAVVITRTVIFRILPLIPTA